MLEDMQDLLRNPRLRPLLRQAEDARRLIESLDNGSAAARDVEETLSGIYRDIGVQLHLQWRALLDGSAPPATAETEEFDSIAMPEPETTGAELSDEVATPKPPRRALVAAPQLDDDDEPSFASRADATAEAGASGDADGDEPRENTEIPDSTALPVGPDQEKDRWYTDEVDWDGNAQPLFAPGDLEAEPEPEDPADVRPIATVTEAETYTLAATPTLRGARDLLTLLDTPTTSEVEASRLQWATSQVDTWFSLPEGLQLALLSFVACRTRHLHDLTEHAIAARFTLDRLRRWHRASRLPRVRSLALASTPETGSWLSDASAWRDTLVLG